MVSNCGFKCYSKFHFLHFHAHLGRLSRRFLPSSPRNVGYLIHPLVWGLSRTSLLAMEDLYSSAENMRHPMIYSSGGADSPMLLLLKVVLSESESFILLLLLWASKRSPICLEGHIRSSQLLGPFLLHSLGASAVLEIVDFPDIQIDGSPASTMAHLISDFCVMEKPYLN